MEKATALNICKLIEECIVNNQTNYDITIINNKKSPLQEFHQWANGKPLIAAYYISKPEEPGYYLLFIDWHRNDRYYLVVYPFNKSTTLAELQNISELEGREVIIWRYNPLKRDGKNQQRKAYFKQIFRSTVCHIPIPESSSDIEVFFNQLILLCLKRLKADRIVDVFD